MNIKIDLDTPLIDFTGEAIKDGDKGYITLAKQLASLLASENSKDESKTHKLPLWASKLYQEGSLQVDEADFKFIKETVLSSERFLPLVKSPILLAMDDAKDKARKANDKKADKK